MLPCKLDTEDSPQIILIFLIHFAILYDFIGQVISVPDHQPCGYGFYSWHFQLGNFLSELCLKWGPHSLVRANGNSYLEKIRGYD